MKLYSSKEDDDCHKVDNLHIRNNRNAFVIVRCFVIVITLALFSCKPIHEVITHHEYVTHTVDSVIYHDSTVVVPHEVFTNVAWPYDTLTLETSLAKAQCWVDSLWLKGTIKNKQQVIYKYIEVEKVRDSIVYEKVPEPYPVIQEVKNPVNRKLLLWAILASIMCVGILYLTRWRP